MERKHQGSRGLAQAGEVKMEKGEGPRVQAGNQVSPALAPKRARPDLLWFSPCSTRAALQPGGAMGCSLLLKASDFRMRGRAMLSTSTRGGYLSKGGGGI